MPTSSSFVGAARRIWLNDGLLASLSSCGVASLLRFVLVCLFSFCWLLPFVCLLVSGCGGVLAWLVMRWPVLLGWFSHGCVFLSAFLLLCPPYIVLPFCSCRNTRSRIQHNRIQQAGTNKSKANSPSHRDPQEARGASSPRQLRISVAHMRMCCRKHDKLQIAQ